mmetsp:Transcript_61736/g.102501  ORF Transcript_61736/g.102501 Transcript_61736/m.102501 type:complete len:93 (+) Transcript_61736:938-1216(+)
MHSLCVASMYIYATSSFMMQLSAELHQPHESTAHRAGGNIEANPSNQMEHAPGTKPEAQMHSLTKSPGFKAAVGIDVDGAVAPQLKKSKPLP